MKLGRPAGPATVPLSAAEVERYQAHLALPRFGAEGQRRLLASRVLLVGLGGLGCPAAQILAAAGVGALGLADDDVVEVTNLQRQPLFGEADLGRSKAAVAAERLAALNGGVDLRPIPARVTASNVLELVAGYDLVVDGSDNYATRYIVNDACVLAGLPLVSGAIHQFEGQVTSLLSPRTPCYRCLFPTPPPEPGACRDTGVFAALAGIVGSLQAAEATRLLADGDSGLLGTLLLVDAHDMAFRRVSLQRDPACALCGPNAEIHAPTAVVRPGRDQG